MRNYKGSVCSGRGEFAHWIAKLQPVYRDYLGVMLYPGTLNVDIKEDYRLDESVAINIPKEAMERYGGSVNVFCAPCLINQQTAFIIRTQANNNGYGDHGLNIIELAAEIRLRDKFQLDDEDFVELQLP